MFMLIMLLLLLPSATNHSLNVTSSTYSQVNELGILVDASIADALADETFENCVLAIQANYNAKCTDYRATLLTRFNALGNNCAITNFSPTLTGSTYSGTYNVSCQKTAADTNSYIEKQFTFSKTIFVNNGGTTCRVRIVDSYGGLDYNQVDYNLSYP